jgi:phosphoribosylaminoimidazole-succinocarboxamide synthase
MNAPAAAALPGLKFLRGGKVRDVYEIDAERLLLVATDRISAFDHVLPDPIPGKGIVLTQLSLYWFRHLGASVPHHVLEADVRAMPPEVRAHEAYLRGRALIVRKASVFPFECVARAYLLGGGFKEYRETGALCGAPLEKGLKKNHRFQTPLFTPATKAEFGHDENVPFERMERDLGTAVATELRDRTLDVFMRCSAHAESRGVIICDTKLEWGSANGRTLLVDEVLTPDSSRFWKKEEALSALPDRDPPSYDKQVVRDWLDARTWDREKGPPPRLPKDVAALATRRYVEIYERIAGGPVPELDS